MRKKLVRFLREYVFGLSIIAIIVGIIILMMGVIWYFLREGEETVIQLGFYTDVILKLGDWNAYLLVIGLIIFGFGLYYLYHYHKLKNFLLEEIQTNKRSELQKRHAELKETAKHLPIKYKKMLAGKEEELRLR